MTILQSIRHEFQALRADGRGRALVVIAAAWGTLIGTRMIYPVVLPFLRESFDLSLTIAGLLVTILWLGSALGQLPGGILADQYSERLVMTVSVLLVAVAVVAVVLAPTATVLFAATAMVGLGQSLYPIARITALSKLYPDRIGSALGVTMATGDLGQTILPPIAGTLAVVIAWQAGLGFTIPLFVVFAAAIWIVVPSDSSAGTASSTGFSADTVRDVIAQIQRSNMLFVSFIFFLYILVWQSFTGFYPTYLVEVKGLSSSVAAVLFSLFFAAGVLVKPISGAAYDRIGLRGSLVLALAGPLAGFLLLPFVDSVVALVVVTALVSTMLGSGAITQSFFADSFTEDVRGTGLGAVRTTTATFGAMGPVLFGAVADRGYFNEGYLIIAGVVFVVIVLTLRLPKE